MIFIGNLYDKIQCDSTILIEEFNENIQIF